MSEQRASMMEPPIEELLDRVDSKFTLVTLSARRGRQINSYFNQLGEGLGTIVPPQVSSQSRKPLSIALEEVAAGKIVAKRREEGAESEQEVAGMTSAEEADALLGDVGVITEAARPMGESVADDSGPEAS